MLKVRDLWKTYTAEGKRVPALRGISFAIGQGEFYTLLGPSGCGKSTALRCVAGLEHPEQGEIWIGTQVVLSGTKNISVPTFKRDVSMVFQSYAIWPHMSVFQNVAFPIVYGKAKRPRGEVRGLVERALSQVGLEELADRSASLLSGGQQQRVALARALVCQPSLLLLDEPLSNLDAKLRDEMRKELMRLVQTLHMTTLYVTHDQGEALSLSHRLGVMRDGNIVQEGTPHEIYFSPQEGFVASFVGRANLVKAVLVSKEKDNRACVLETVFGRVRCMAEDAGQEGDDVLLSIRPEGIALHAYEPDADTNVLAGRIESVTFMGESVECQVRVGTTLIEAKAPGVAKLEQGQKVYLHMPPERCVVVSAKKLMGQEVA